MEFEIVEALLKHEFGNNLVGEILTIADACAMDQTAKKSVKTIMRQAIRSKLAKVLNMLNEVNING